MFNGGLKPSINKHFQSVLYSLAAERFWAHGLKPFFAVNDMGRWF
ncbi:hypothetical protein SGRA_3563 [Saprospira grandis str. Lewin]|uniref:Uncharacterized protein n=1 Tax=Saprospira grandis (strain Lewin) TaxID=984262 RepID=H6L5N7_SAPGL|nr:hypothetical protein SGRA_3563 [Saprospira grandis str. Lewin]